MGLSHVQRLEAFLLVLPDGSSFDSNVPQSERARGFLAFIVNWALLYGEGQLPPASTCGRVPGGSACCPNCGKGFANERSPYCSTRCRDEASFVRSFRSGLQGELFENQDRQIMLGQIAWTLLGGGFPLRQSQVPQKTRQQVMARHQGRCELCTMTATTIDHIRTGCNRPINLRPVCDRCARTKEFGDESLLNNPQVQAHLELLAPRLGAARPLRECDDSSAWDWREFLRRRQREAVTRASG